MINYKFVSVACCNNRETVFITVYLPFFLTDSILWRQRVIFLSHLNQLFFNNLFLLQQSNIPG